MVNTNGFGIQSSSLWWSWKAKDGPEKYRKHFELLSEMLDEINGAENRTPRTLVRPKPGGDLFLAATGEPKLLPADINAAINVGLRALAKPDRFEFHHRIRARVKAGKLEKVLGNCPMPFAKE